MSAPLPILTGLCIAIMALASIASAQSNDAFATPADLSSLPLPITSYSGTPGTAEPGEPAHAGSPAASSIWFRWTAPSSEIFAFGEWLNSGTARIAVYTGTSLTSLSLVAQGLQRVAFRATAGTTYRIALDTPGPDVYYLRSFPPGGSDEPGAAESVNFTDTPISIRGNNVLATTSPVDGDLHPPFPPARTVWWKWTAPFTGPVRVDNRLCQFSPIIDILTLNASNTFQQTAVGFNAVGWFASAGVTYFLRIDDTGGLGGEINLWMEKIPSSPPSNDLLANATDLGSSAIACGGAWLFFASSESGAPNESVGIPSIGIPGDYTAWWKWTCPRSGFHRISTHGSDGYLELYLYNGPPSTSSLLSSSSNTTGIRFSATAGTTYWIKALTNFRRCVRAEINVFPAASESAYFQTLDSKGCFRLTAEQRLPDADPDGDGLPNLVEISCGTNLERPDATHPNAPRIVNSPSGPRLRWGAVFNSGPTLDHFGEVASHPAGPWTTAPRISESTDTYSIPLPPGPTGFARLVVRDPSLSQP